MGKKGKFFPLYALVLQMILFPGASVSADSYVCEQNGKKFFTDDPANLPAGCRNVERRPSEASVNIVEESTYKEILIQAEKESEERAKRIEKMKNDAQSLVIDYKNAVTRRFKSTFVSDQLKAVSEITAIKNRRNAMEKEIERLPTRPREEIQAILSEIPSD